MNRAHRVAWCIALMAMSAPAFAQGQGHGRGQGQARGQQSNPPPSRNDLPSPVVAPSALSVTPFAWIDDATLLQPGVISVALSVARWSGSSGSEVDAPVIDVAAGVSRRVHFTATIPRVIGSDDPLGAAGGVGTSYIGAKIAVLDPARRVKVSATPTLEVLGSGLSDAVEGGGRMHVGLPGSAEIDYGPARLYGGGGFFSRGIWFAGGGVGMRIADNAFASIAYSRSWRTSGTADVPLSLRARADVIGAVSYAVASNVSVFGSLGRTIGTLAENGAGTTLAGGVAFAFASIPNK